MIKLIFSKTISNNQIVQYSATGGVLRQFYSKVAKEYIKTTKEEISKQYFDNPIDYPVSVKIRWERPFLNKGNGEIKKIDVDNILKGLINCFTGTVLEDDSLIFKLDVEKVHIENGERVVVTIDKCKDIRR